MNYQEVMAMATSGNTICAGTYNDGVYISTDKGINWARTEMTYPIFSLAASGDTVFAGTDVSGVFRSVDKGLRWTQTSLNDKHICALAINGSNIFAAGGGVYHSTDNGVSWSAASLQGHSVYSLAVSGDTVYAGTESGVYVSINNGGDWTQTALNNQYVYALATYGNYVFAGTDTYPQGSGGVYFSRDRGVSWIDVNQGFNVIPTVYSLLINHNFIYAGTAGNGVWKRPLSEMPNGINDIPENSHFSVYPNPASDVITVDIDRNIKADFTLNILNITGSSVKTKHFKQNQQQINTGNLPNGIYMVEIKTKDWTGMQKIIIQK